MYGVGGRSLAKAINQEMGKAPLGGGKAACAPKAGFQSSGAAIHRSGSTLAQQYSPNAFQNY